MTPPRPRCVPIASQGIFCQTCLLLGLGSRRHVPYADPAHIVTRDGKQDCYCAAHCPVHNKAAKRAPGGAACPD